MKFPLSLPMVDPTITFAIWDKDILSPNDFISEGTLSFLDMAQKAFSNDCSIKLAGNKGASLDAAVSSALNPADKAKNKEQVQKYTCALKNVEKSGYVA